jgi:predicted nucleic acid-binding protein
MGTLLDTTVFIELERAIRWRVGTANVKHFERIPELDVQAITWRTEA